MARKKATFFPRKKGDVKDYMDNVDDKLIGGFATKYSISATKSGRITFLRTNIPTALTTANAAMQAAQGLVNAADQLIHEADLLNTSISFDMQESSVFDTADYESIGYGINHTPPDPNAAQPVISQIMAVDDKVIIDFIKGSWHGVRAFYSYDGVTWTKGDPDTRSPYEDSRFNQQQGVPEVRWYKFRFIDKTEKEIGVASQPVKIVAQIYQP